MEDIIGGHTAIGNLLVKVLGFVATRPNVQKVAQEEIDSLGIAGNFVGLENRRSLPYVEAIILETIRIIASPIVPHVANQDSSIAGKFLSLNARLWIFMHIQICSWKFWNFILHTCVYIVFRYYICFIILYTVGVLL